MEGGPQGGSSDTIGNLIKYRGTFVYFLAMHVEV